MPLSAFQPKNLFNQVVDALGRRVVAGFYPEGQKMPIEAELCAEYGISRPIMREATKVLMARGLVESKPRVGTVVRPRKHWNLLDADVLGWMIQALPEEEFLDMLFEVRLAIEPAAAELAATNGSEDDKAAITLAYTQMAEAKSAEELLEPDIHFHQAIMDATHNDLMSYIGRTLQDALAVSIRLTSRHPNTHELSLPRHKNIADAIAAGDGAAAHQATVILLKDSRQDFDQVKG